MNNIFSIEPSGNRIYGLDILRSIAILFVIISHGRFLVPEPIKSYHEFIVLDGVSIFFVLSGYLIGGILIKILDKNRPTVPLLFNFWLRRWFRTLPNYFFILLILLTFSYLKNDEWTFWRVKEYFLFSQNLYFPHPDFFPEAWSLSIEEWFYIITPIGIFSLMIFGKLPSKQALLLVVISIIIGVLFFRFLRFITTDINDLQQVDLLFRKQVVTRLDSLMYGVLAAYIHYYFPVKWSKNNKLLLVTGISIFVTSKLLIVTDLISSTDWYNCIFSYSVTSVATILLLPYLSNYKAGKGKIYKALTTISLISYSMYLLNLSVIQHNILNEIAWLNVTTFPILIPLIKYLLFWFLTIASSILLYKYFEIPTTKLRDHPRIKQILSRLN